MQVKLDLDPINKVPLFPRPGVDPDVERYGRFSDDGREYLIDRPDTPQPWYNYLTNRRFTSYVSQTGGGTCFCDDPVEKRILRVHLHGRPADQPGRWLYVRDRDSGAVHLATWAPVYMPPRKMKYQCRVGAGYSVITIECNKIRTELTFFVGPDATAETWLLKVANLDARARKLDIFPYAELLYWSLMRDCNLDAAFKCTDVAVAPKLIVHQSYYDFGEQRGGWKRQFGYFASSAAPASVDTNLDAFVGVFRGYDKPLALERGRCSDYVNRGGEPIAAMQVPLSLKAGASAELAFAVGYAVDLGQAKRQGRKVANVAFAQSQLDKIRRQWRDYLDRFQADTGDRTFDVPFNTFSPYQSAMTFICSRAIAPYLLTGTRGLGYRDSNQDVLSAVTNQPYQATRKLIGTLLSVQRPEGDACHDFFPGTGEGRGEGCWDDHLWPALSVQLYVQESGDLAFLNEKLPYVTGGEPTPVIEHLERALRFTDVHVGDRGLPLLGRADWNDCLNAFPGAESLFTAGLYCAACKAIESLHAVRGDAASARRCAERHANMSERINRHGWDGKWYVRLITREGDPIGSASNRYGKIFIESNTWAVIGQAAPPERARQALDSVRRRLGTLYGHRLCWPPYPEYDPTVGTCTIFSPGIKENGAVFCHTNPWLVVAEAMLGRGERAYDVFRRVSPYTKDQIQAIHCAEPYAVNSLVYMPPNKEAGRARNPWLTGFASWLLACMQRSILGIRPDYAGLVIDPCVPRWKQLRVRRLFRGTWYDIAVSNPDGVERGVRELRVDGRAVEGNLVPLPPAGKRSVKVEVVMGR